MNGGSEVRRPLLRYHGGKWKLAPWIISHFPPHRAYCEPYGGAASVLLQKSRVYSEIYNDLDGEVVNLMRVLRQCPQELVAAVRWTPYSRAEFDLSYEPSDDPLEQARRTLFRSAAGFSTASMNGKKWKTGFRSNVSRSSTTPARDWANTPKSILAAAERMRGVIIEEDEATAVMLRYDSPDTLHYLDPVYVQSTRNQRHVGNVYRHEMTDNDHRDMAETVIRLSGMVALSGYYSELYNQELFPEWRLVMRDTFADGGSKRTECLWLSPSLVTRLETCPIIDLMREMS